MKNKYFIVGVISIIVIVMFTTYQLFNKNNQDCGKGYGKDTIINFINSNFKSCDYYIKIKKEDIEKELSIVDSHKFIKNFKIDTDINLNIDTNFENIYYFDIIDKNNLEVLGTFEIRDNFLFINQKYYKFKNNDDIKNYLKDMFE